MNSRIATHGSLFGRTLLKPRKPTTADLLPPNTSPPVAPMTCFSHSTRQARRIILQFRAGHLTCGEELLPANCSSLLLSSVDTIVPS